MFEHHYTQIPSEVKYKNRQKAIRLPAHSTAPCMHDSEGAQSAFAVDIRFLCSHAAARACARPRQQPLRPKGMLPATSHVTEYVDHPRKPRQLACKAAAQLRQVFIPLADIEKAASAVNGKVQSAVAIEIHGKFPEGGIRQRQNPRRTVGHQDAQSGGFIAELTQKCLSKSSLPVGTVLTLRNLSSPALGQMVSHVGNAQLSSHSSHWPV